ncbi:hypothetical protein ACHAWF_003634, partial [Thalassiosira exigua]
KRGKANGLFCDSLDTFIRIAKSTNPWAHKALRRLFRRIYNNDLDESVIPYFTNTYLFCLHKDEKDSEKQRPIGVPTALRRNITSHVAKSLRSKFARRLLPYNYAIGVDGGIDLIVRCAQLEVERHITLRQERDEAPTRAFISLDIANMFNCVSCKEIFRIVRRELPELLPLVDLLYGRPGKVYFKMIDGRWHTQTAEEGTNQGCPLSSTLAALVLHEVIAPLTRKLDDRAAARLADKRGGDDDLGGRTDAKAYVDDTGAAIPLEDLRFFLEEFTRLATPLGLHLNRGKTLILLSTSGKSAIPAIREEQGDTFADDIADIIDEFSGAKRQPDGSYHGGKEVMSGLRLLGQPVGSSNFATEFNALQMEANKADAEALFRTVPDRHTALRLFTQCTLHRLPHLLGSEVLYAHDPTVRQQWDAWVSPLSESIDTMADGFIAKLTGRSSIPADSLLIAYITIAQGGLGFMDPFTRAVPDFVLTMSRAARYAEHGVRLGRGEDNVRLPNSFSRLFSLSHNRDSRILTSFYSLLGDVGGLATTKECPDTLDYFLRRGSLRSARDRLRQAASGERRPRQTSQADRPSGIAPRPPRTPPAPNILSPCEHVPECPQSPQAQRRLRSRPQVQAIPRNLPRGQPPYVPLRRAHRRPWDAPLQLPPRLQEGDARPYP